MIFIRIFKKSDMSIGKRLTEKEQGKIEALRKEGHSYRDIVEKINRSSTVVHNFIKLGTKYGLIGKIEGDYYSQKEDCFKQKCSTQVISKVNYISGTIRQFLQFLCLRILTDYKIL